VKRWAKEAELCQQDQDPFGLEIKLETNHAVKNFKRLELNPFWNMERTIRNPPGEPGSCSTSLSVAARSKCSAASATKETPAIAAFSHFLYAADETTPANHPVVTRAREIF
jgi:hypothetical protein